jgi:GntR family transcriptional regulator, transcriptional repressor for pyruvate dehydrogenase complex
MAFREIVAPTLRDLFVRQIIDMIFSGELKTGEKLPTERDMAEKMNISRSMVHIGLEDLNRMGFVRIEPRAGAYVADYAGCGNFETLGAIVKYTGGKLSEELNISMVEARNALEGGALIRLALTHSGEDIRSLRERAAELEKAAAGGAELKTIAEMMRDFHVEMTRMSGNLLFPLILNSFNEVSLGLWENCVAFWGTETIIQQEAKLIDLLEDGRGHEAALYIENIFEHYLDAHDIHR